VHRAELIPLIADVMRTRTKHEWIGLLEAANVPCGPINNMKEVFEDPQVRHRELRVDIPHPSGGSAAVVRSPLRLSETPVEYKLAPPTLGQHNEEILKGLLGRSDADLAKLKASGIV
jgi:formyl-CoA transferase